MYDESKVYFAAGDEVTLKQDVSNKPIMIVQSVDKADMTNQEGSRQLLGVSCLWFDMNQEVRVYRFSTKDLVHYDGSHR